MKVSFNGKVIEVRDGAKISVNGNKIYVNGQRLSDTGEENYQQIVVDGVVGDISTDCSVKVKGNVTGNIKAGGSVSCGDVGGTITADGSINCGDVKGRVKAGGSISCGDIYGGNLG